MRKLRIACAVILLAFLGVSSVHAQVPGESPYIYRIVAEGCQHAPKTRTLSGFRLQGTPGIITALHGIVDDCEKIEAKALNAPDISKLEIDQVDILHDIAVLNPESGEPLSAQEGLLLGNDVIGEDKISVRGYPYGITAQLPSTDLQLRKSPVVQLQSLLSSEIFKLLSQRKSPEPTITVLNIEGDLLPGHSGAPIFNSKGEVIGVGNGGLYLSSITWAIPWAEVGLTTTKDKELEALKEFSPSSLFEFPQLFSSTPPEEWLPLEITINGEQEPIKQTILRNGGYTYELVTQHQGSSYPSVIIKHNGNVMATGRINDERLQPQGETKLRLQLKYCEVFLCLRSSEQSLNEIVFIDKATQIPIARAKVTFKWVDTAGAESTAKTDETDDEGKILLSQVPEDAEYVRIVLERDPCYDWRRSVPISELPAPILVTSRCTPTLTWTATPTNTETRTVTPEPTFTSTPTITETATLTVAPTDIPTPTPIATETVTPANTATATVADTVTPTWTLTSAATPTETPSPSFTPTDIPVTPTLTALPASTPIPTILLTATSTAIPQPTATSTVTGTGTSTSTVAPTSTPTVTQSPTATVTPTDTLTPTTTSTWTSTITQSPTPTSTPTATSVPPILTATPVLTDILVAPTLTTSSQPLIRNTREERGVNIRSGPNTTYSELDVLPLYKSLKIVGRYDAREPGNNFTWWQVELATGRKGWVRSDVVIASGDVMNVPLVTDIPSTPIPTATVISVSLTPSPVDTTLTSTFTHTPTLTPTPTEVKSTAPAVETKPPAPPVETKPPAPPVETKPAAPS